MEGPIATTIVCGGPGGSPWSINENGMANFKQIVIRHGDSIDSITFKQELNGKTGFSTFGEAGRLKSQIDLGPHEYITSVSGYFDDYVNALKLDTNVKEYGFFGREQGTYFKVTVAAKDLKIVGFHGRSGEMIDAIGVYMQKPSNNISPQKPLHVGPWGGPGGAYWSVNENGNGVIKKIIISWGSNTQSLSLMFILDVNGETQYSGDYGAAGSSKGQITLDSPREYLTCLSGYSGYTCDTADGVIRSLRFCTNLRKYVPVGREEGSYFTSPVGKIVGMHGRSGTLLDAVGVFMAPY